MSPTDPSARVFLACAPQDLKFAELITARARADRLPFVCHGMGEGRADEIRWQMECRRRIRASQAFVVLVGPHARESARVRWQVQCAREFGVPVLGITVGFEDEARADQAHRELEPDASLVNWKWKTIAATLLRFVVGPHPGAKTGPAPEAGRIVSGPTRQGTAA